ncbi:carboxymuconolactone decarboxylase family protein [Lichenicoccus sp.]|uniref:carboxymuconolactone decarboxylase family protein n=1 Tax=Lichenicoccus sp. TaxID=2781899 RepID=UPI003D149150
MSDAEASLGGRLPLLRPADLNAAQKALWDRMSTTVAADVSKTGAETRTADDRFIGPFNPMLRSPEIAQTFLQLQLDEAKGTSLSERVRQIVILSVGSVWHSPYELYAHAAAARKAGFFEDCVAALVAGEPSSELATEEALAQRLALALTTQHAADDELYAEALQRFGEKGLVDFAVLAGCYHLVCGLLNLFAVPAPKAA